jgi:hypothetical protein
MNEKDTGVSDQSTAEVVVRAVPRYPKDEPTFVPLTPELHADLLKGLSDEELRGLRALRLPSLPEATLLARLESLREK